MQSFKNHLTFYLIYDRIKLYKFYPSSQKSPKRFVKNDENLKGIITLKNGLMQHLFAIFAHLYKARLRSSREDVFCVTQSLLVIGLYRHGFITMVLVLTDKLVRCFIYMDNP